MKILFALPLLLTAHAVAADTDWNNLRTLKQGDRIEIVQSDQKRVKGTFAGFTESAISVEADGAASVPRGSVIRVDRLPRTRRLIRTVIGACAGVAAGLIVNATAGERFRNEGQSVSSAALIAGGAGLGAGIGALTGGGRHTIFRRP